MLWEENRAKPKPSDHWWKHSFWLSYARSEWQSLHRVFAFFDSQRSLKNETPFSIQQLLSDFVFQEDSMQQILRSMGRVSMRRSTRGKLVSLLIHRVGHQKTCFHFWRMGPATREQNAQSFRYCLWNDHVAVDLLESEARLERIPGRSVLASFYLLGTGTSLGRTSLSKVKCNCKWPICLFMYQSINQSINSSEIWGIERQPVFVFSP